MKKIVLLIVPLLLLTACQSEASRAQDSSQAQEEYTPAKLLSEISPEITESKADASDGSIIMFFCIDTLNYTQEEYEAVVNYMRDRAEAGEITEKKLIEALCEIHLAAARAYTRDPENYSKTTCLSAEAENDQNTTAHLKAKDYLHDGHVDDPTIRDELSFRDISVSIDGDTAKVSLRESYMYLSTAMVLDGSYDVSGGSCGYEMNLQRIDDKWLITSVYEDSILASSFMRKSE